GFGFGNLFVLAIDSNIASDPTQLAWVTAQLEQLDRARYEHVIVVMHHPTISSGPHGGPTIEPPTLALRTLYVPLFRRHHVRMILAGHDHLLDHWVERSVDPANGRSYRCDQIVSGGGGAPHYNYAGEPDLSAYLAAGQAQRVRVDHLMKPDLIRENNPYHFVVIKIDR